MLIVGLGNPGSKYHFTRHNLGFLILDHFLEDCGLSFKKGTGWKRWLQAQTKSIWQTKYQGEFLEADSANLQFDHPLPKKTLFLKPQTYMNLSGESVVGCLKGQHRQASDMIVVHDDLDIAPGKVKVKFAGGHGGHNGLRSIIECIGSNQFWRLRIGVGKPSIEERESGSDYLLRSLSAEQLQQPIDVGVQTLHEIVENGYQKGMHVINTRMREED